MCPSAQEWFDSVRPKTGFNYLILIVASVSYIWQYRLTRVVVKQVIRARVRFN